MLYLVLILAVLAAAAVCARLWHERTTVTVWDWEVGLLFHYGRFVKELPPGRYRVGLEAGLPGRAVRRLATGPMLLAVQAQEVLTADGFTVKLGALLEWRIVNAHRHYVFTGGNPAAQGWTQHLLAPMQLGLRTAASTRTLDELLAIRADAGALEAAMLPAIAAKVAEAGGAVDRLGLRDLILPAEVRRMVTEAERARREGQAALERARGEQAALRSLANAARLLRGNPELQALRTLQALSSAAPGRPAPTLVLGVPPFVPVPAAPEGPAAAPDA